MKKFSPIKQRILQFVDSLNISKRNFYEITGVSRGTLESSSSITEDIMAKIIAKYGEINIEWLITGKEPMLKKDILQLPSEAEMDRLADVEKILVDQIRENYQLKGEIEKLKKEISALKAKLSAQ